MQLNTKTNNPIKKWAEDMNRHFSKEDKQMANKNKKNAQHHSFQRNANQTIMRYHLTWVRMIIIKKLQTINAGEDVEKREHSYTVGRNAN